MREKGKLRKEKKILIRVNKEEKALADELSSKEGKNTSEFFRGLLKEKKTVNDLMPLFNKIVAQNERLIKIIEKNGLKGKKNG